MWIQFFSVLLSLSLRVFINRISNSSSALTAVILTMSSSSSSVPLHAICRTSSELEFVRSETERWSCVYKTDLMLVEDDLMCYVSEFCKYSHRYESFWCRSSVASSSRAHTSWRNVDTTTRPSSHSTPSETHRTLWSAAAIHTKAIFNVWKREEERKKTVLRGSLDSRRSNFSIFHPGTESMWVLHTRSRADSSFTHFSWTIDFRFEKFIEKSRIEERERTW